MYQIQVIGDACPIQQLEIRHEDGVWALVTPGEWGDGNASIRIYDAAQCMTVEEATALRDTLTYAIRRAHRIEKMMTR